MPPGQAREVVLRTRVRRSTFDLIDSLAKARGRSRSAWVREAISEKVSRDR